MKRGDIVEIAEMTIGGTLKWERAKLIRKLPTERFLDPDEERWQVQFSADLGEPAVERFLHPDNCRPVEKDAASPKEVADA